MVSYKKNKFTTTKPERSVEYRNTYFKECNHAKIVFEKNAFNVLSNCDLPNVRALGQNKINRSK